MAVAHPPQDPTPLLPPVKVRGLAELQNADRMTENLWASLDRPSDLEVLAAFSHLRGVSIDNITGDGGALWSFEPLAACVSR